MLQILQGFSGTMLYWDELGHSFRVRSGIYVSHLSHTSLYHVLNQFTYAATCLKMVESRIHKVEKSVPSPPPTLRAFCCSISTWLTVSTFCYLHFLGVCMCMHWFILKEDDFFPILNGAVVAKWCVERGDEVGRLM